MGFFGVVLAVLLLVGIVLGGFAPFLSLSLLLAVRDRNARTHTITLTLAALSLLGNLVVFGLFVGFDWWSWFWLVGAVLSLVTLCVCLRARFA
jgi:hypothetical protein